MRKFVRYLYEYRNGNRVQNVGFVKVETSGNATVIQIYGKGFPATGRQPLEIFLFYLNGNQCIGIPVGQMEIAGPMANHRIEISGMNEEIRGIILRGENLGTPAWYAGIWEERQVDVEHMVIHEEKEPEITETALPEAEVVSEPQVETETESEQGSESVVYKITRQDLVKLPRREWKLANNHFLLHGCRNYHHLVSFEKDGFFWIGVPGIYHPKEHQAAEAFGFGEFMKPEEGEISLTEEEQTEEGVFGYWCRIVSNIISQ